MNNEPFADWLARYSEEKRVADLTYEQRRVLWQFGQAPGEGSMPEPVRMLPPITFLRQHYGIPASATDAQVQKLFQATGVPYAKDMSFWEDAADQMSAIRDDGFAMTVLKAIPVIGTIATYAQQYSNQFAPEEQPTMFDGILDSIFAPTTNGGSSYGGWDLARDALRAYVNTSTSSRGIPDYGPIPQQAMPMVTQAAWPTLPALGLGTALTGMGAAALGIVRSAGGRILRWVLPSGQKVSRKAAVELAKQVGLAAAAGAIGASVTDLAEAIIQEEGKPRRARGISAAALRVTTRTMGRVEAMHRRIAKAAKSSGRCR